MHGICCVNDLPRLFYKRGIAVQKFGRVQQVNEPCVKHARKRLRNELNSVAREIGWGFLNTNAMIL